MLAMAVPLWASEHTVTINRNEGLYQTGTGVYYCVKDGIMMTFTSGLDNENYLVEHQQVYFEVNSYNYIIKRIVFHCVDSTTTANLMDCFYWGPTTLSIVQNFYNQSEPGTLTVTDPYTAVWRGSSNHMQFTTMAKPVRFGSVEIVYDKLDGDIFDLVTSTSQIQDGKTYILVTQNDNKVMRIKMTDDATFPATPIVDWMGPDGNEKSRVKVDGNAQLFRMEMVVDTTIDGYSRKSAWLNTLNGYIRPSSTSGSTDLTLSTGVTDWNRSYSYIGTASNFLARFKSKGSGYYIRYDSSNNGKFRMYNSTSDENTRVWLYKLAEAYNITTVCDPASGGTLTLGDGAVNSTSQQGETVNFTATPNAGYSLTGVDVTADGTTTTIPVTDNGDGTYSFVMPAQDVTVTAHFEIAGAYQIFTENTPAGGGVVNVGGQVTTVDGNNYANGGNSVTVTPSPNWGWEATGVTVTDANNNEVTVTDNGNGSYSFTMPVADATVHAGYKRVVGDIFDLVTSGTQIVEGSTYIIVSQNYDKVMRYWTPGQTTFTSADIVDWPLGSDNKTKVRVDDNAVFFRMDNLKTDTTSTGGLNLTRAAFLNTMNGYMRTGNYNVFLSSPLAQVNRGSMMVSGNAYNYLLRFLYDNTSGPNTNYVVRYNNADGNFNVLNWTNQTDNANVLTRVWLYKLAQAYSISTVCTPPEGGSITITGGMDESNMAQGGETVTFWVGTNWGYRISQVVVTNNATGEETVLNPTTTAADGNNYSFVMPDANVTITATFYETENDLYLLGTAMGRTIWCPSGPMFNYDPVNEQYYLDVYFKGVNNDEYGYFSLAQHVSDFDWKNRTSTDDNLWGQVTGRLAAQYNDYGVQDGSTNVPLYNDRPNNAFKIKAGIYRITVNRAMTQMSITETPRTLTFTPAGDDLENGTPVPYGQVVELSSDIQSLVWPIAQRYGLTEDAQQFKIKGVDDQLYRDNDNDTVITQLGKTTLAGMAYIGHITAEDTAAYRIDDYAIHTVVNPAGTATINVQDGATTAAYGQTVTFTINDIATDYTLAEVTLTNETTGEITTLTPSSGTYSFVMPDAPVTITANLKTMHMVRATWNPVAGGSVTIGDGTFPAYYNDEDVNFTVDVNPGYVISSIAVTAGSNNVNYTDNGNGNYSFTMPTSDVLIHVEYGYDPACVYNITTVCDPVGAGEFSQVASTSSAGEPVAFTVTPNLGYQLSEVTVTADGTTTTLTPDENGNYSFNMPTADVTVTAHFVTGYHVTTRVLPVLPDDEVCGELNAYWLDHLEVVDYFAPGTPVTADLRINKHYVMDSVVLTYGDVVYHLPMEYDGDDYCAYTFDMPESDVIVTAYLRLNTPLSYIETPGNFENGDRVTVTDTLIGAWAARYYLWAKDQAPYVSNDFVEIPEGQTDYVRRNLKLQIHDWDQSNWVMLDFSNLITGNNDNGDPWPTAEEWTRIQDLVDHRIEPSSIHGTYVYDLSTVYGDASSFESHHKCRIILDDWPVPIDPDSHESLGYPGYVQDPLELPAPDGYYEDPTTYRYNHYTPANFLYYNIGGSHGVVGIEGVMPGQAANPDYDNDTNLSFFFMNPKDQEIAQVWAVWLGEMSFQGQCSNQEITADVFEVFKPYPEEYPTVNGYDLSGAFYVPSWNFNRLSPFYIADAYGKPVVDELQPNTAYQFHVAIMTRNEVNEVSKKAPKREDAAAPEATKTEPWDFYEVYPLDLQSHSTNYTAVQEIMPREASQIESIRYYNVMGQESRTPFDGINIEVIRYKDGSSISRKILR